METADAPLPEAPDIGKISVSNEERAPSATAAVLAAPSTIAATTQVQPNSLFVQSCQFFAAITNTIVPAPVRNGWHYLFTTFLGKYPSTVRYGAFGLIILIAVAEWQQPGFIPRTDKVTNAIVGLLCATLIVGGVIVLQEYIENSRWPWEEEGWVWPWEAWLWSGTAYDLGASTNTSAEGDISPLPLATPSVAAHSPRASMVASPAPYTDGSTPTSSAQRDSLAMPPPTTFKQPFIIPPTPQLPGGLRPFYIPPPTPAQIHHSGLLGESPMPHKLKHFSGDYFHRNAQKLGAVSEWSAPGSPPLESIRKRMLSIAEGVSDGESKVAVQGEEEVLHASSLG